MAGESGHGPQRSSGGRVAWVDAAKGVGILLVIAGHVWWQPGPVHRIIYTFHMPLFFLLSGYMVKPQPTGQLIVRQARSLLLPYALFSLLLIATDLWVEGWRGHQPIFAGYGSGLEAILLHTEHLRGPFTILWFVPCLFLARLAWNGVARVLPDPWDGRWAVLVGVVMAGAHWLSARTEASPLGLMAVPMALALYWIGQLWRSRPPGPLLVVALAVLGWAALFAVPPVNMKAGDYSVPVVALGGAAGISILLCLLLARLPASAARPLAWLGQVSLVIMYVHVAFIHYLSPYAPPWILFAVALAGSVAVHLLIAATRPGRMLLLGERG